MYDLDYNCVVSAFQKKIFKTNIINKMYTIKKILIIAPSNKGTIGLRSRDLYKAFSVRSNFETSIIYLHKFKDGFDIDGHEYCDIYNRSVFYKAVHFIKEILWIRAYKRRFKPDVSISTLTACIVCNILSGCHEYKIGVFRAPYEQKTAGIGIIAKLFHHILYPYLDSMVGVSEEVTKSMKNNFPKIPSEKFHTIYNAFFIDELIEKSNSDVEANEKLIFNSNVILCLGRLKWLKGPDRVIKAFANSHLRTSYNLVFIGKDVDSITEQLIYLSKINGVGNKVFFLGHKNNPYKYISRASLIVSGSKTEGLPGVLIESLLLEKPIISSNSSYGVWEILNCQDQYDSKLDDIYIAKDGIISSNLPDEDLNVKTLTKAINAYQELGLQVTNFIFKSKVNPDIIVDDYLKQYSGKNRPLS